MLSQRRPSTLVSSFALFLSLAITLPAAQAPPPKVSLRYDGLYVGAEPVTQDTIVIRFFKDGEAIFGFPMMQSSPVRLQEAFVRLSDKENAAGVGRYTLKDDELRISGVRGGFEWEFVGRLKGDELTLTRTKSNNPEPWTVVHRFEPMKESAAREGPYGPVVVSRIPQVLEVRLGTGQTPWKTGSCEAKPIKDAKFPRGTSIIAYYLRLDPDRDSHFYPLRTTLVADKAKPLSVTSHCCSQSALGSRQMGRTSLLCEVKRSDEMPFAPGTYSLHISRDISNMFVPFTVE